MFHSVYKRNKAQLRGITKYASLSKDSAADEFQRLRAVAASRFLMIDIDLDSDHGDHSEGSVNPIEPAGRVRIPREPGDYENELGWTLEKPQDNDYNGILLSSDRPSIPSVASQFCDTDFVIEDFDLGSPHSWRRRF